MRHWSREGPPAYIAVAAYLGLRRDRTPAHDAGEELLDVLRTFPGGERI